MEASSSTANTIGSSEFTFFCCLKLDPLESIVRFGVFCVQVYEVLVSSSFEAEDAAETNPRGDSGKRQAKTTKYGLREVAGN
jgi:hypothetical protein